MKKEAKREKGTREKERESVWSIVRRESGRERERARASIQDTGRWCVQGRGSPSWSINASTHPVKWEHNRHRYVSVDKCVESSGSATCIDMCH